MAGAQGRQLGGSAVQDGPIRWECRCQQTPVLLGTYDPGGQIHIKVRDRHWHVLGSVQTRCPRCGAEHALDLGVGSRQANVESEPARRQDGETARRGDT